MGWFSNLFSSSTANASARRKMTLSTHDAFSLPTSSPLTASHQDSFARPGPDGLDVEVMTPSSSTYAYPPPVSPTTYDYIPRQNGRILSSQSRQSSLLPLHSNTPLSPLPPYPPLQQTWARLQRWLSREYPELGDTLNYGILPQDLADIEMALGLSLPTPVRESYLVVDGQEAESSAGCSEGLFFGLQFLPLEDVLEEWRFWREVDNDPATGANPRLKEIMKSIPPGWVRREYSQRGWIPLITDKTGNYLGVDVNPDESGAVGQVIVFGRDFDTKVVMWRGDGATGWATWLAGFVDDLESGEGFELGQQSDGSEGSEDDVGYESYFFDGSGRAKGEGAGDAGSGIRLTGEYRGWNVLEAWADKSLKKWRQQGLLPNPSSPEPKAKTAKHGLGVLDLAASSSGSGAEVPIPVVDASGERYDDQATPTAALTDMTNRTSNTNPNKSPAPLPTISVTRPPAPRPVELPSPQDFQSPSPTDSRGTSFDNDLERGRQYSLDDVAHPLSHTAVPVKSTPPTTPTVRRPNDSISTVKEATLVQIALDEPSQEKSEDVSDLLQETDSSVTVAPLEPVSTPVIEAKPMTSDSEKDLSALPTSSTTPTVQSSFMPSEEETEPGEEKPEAETGESEVPNAAEKSEKKLEDEENPDQTVRLVGGGGAAGVVAEPESVDENTADADRAEAASASSVTSARNSTDAESAKGAKATKHEKKKSLSENLKRMSKFGGSKRRTDSKENVGGL